MACEVCGAPTTCRCAGLDVPTLDFCDVHGDEHARACKDIKRGAARMDRIPSRTDPGPMTCPTCGEVREEWRDAVHARTPAPSGRRGGEG